MFDLIISCCGTVKSADVFEQARVASTEPNWQVSPNQPLQTILSIMHGHQPLADAQISMNNLLAHLQQDEARKNVTFVLKNLVLLDLIAQQRLFLNKIGRYYNSQLIYMEQEGQTHKAVASIKDLIASYYVYIKQKSKYYELQSKQLLQQRAREAFIEKSNSVIILNEVNYCFKIQNLILDVNSKYKSGDKSSELVQFIFSLLLKTYIFCHSIVSISLRTFAKRIPQLSKYDLEYIKKFATFFNKEYTKNFILFLNSNQNVPSFQGMQYKEMLVSDEKILAIIEAQLQLILQDPGICPDPEDINQEKLKQMAIAKQKQKQKERNQITTFDSLGEEQEILQKRKQYMLQEASSSQPFTQYVNFYSEMEQQTDTSPQNMVFMDPADIFGYYGVPIPQDEPEQQETQQPQAESPQKVQKQANQAQKEEHSGGEGEGEPAEQG